MNCFKVIVFLHCLLFIFSCGHKHAQPSPEVVSGLNLKKGPVISCSPGGDEFGIVHFNDINYNNEIKSKLNTAIALLHSFEYDEAEKAFADIIELQPDCALAYWGVAMSNFHPLWEPPSPADLAKGAKAVAIAQSIRQKSVQETGFINAVAAYYKNWQQTDPKTRNLQFEKAMGQLHQQHPKDIEATLFYTLALDAAADPGDKTLSRQKKAGQLLDSLYKNNPDHPGIVHYIIHTYDYPALAAKGLDAARRYAKVAPASAHALHMPSHIFTRLGLWDDCIQSNIQSVNAAKCYAQATGIKGHWDEELHGLDYLVYAYLQKADDKAAMDQLDYLKTFTTVQPINFKTAYSFAAIPSRIALENKNWQQAARLSLLPANYPWNKFPWQEAMLHFARLLGAAHINDLKAANIELRKLQQLRDTLQNQGDVYKTKQVAIQVKAGEAWIKFASGDKSTALQYMSMAAAMEDSTTKHPVTPGELLPAKEQYADMLLEIKQYKQALQAYEEALQKSPNRWNSLHGAATAAEKYGDTSRAALYYGQLIKITAPRSARPVLQIAKLYLNKSSYAIHKTGSY